jgi:hypothetical protein
MPTENNRPKDENSPNQVTLSTVVQSFAIYEKIAVFALNRIWQFRAYVNNKRLIKGIWRNASQTGADFTNIFAKKLAKNGVFYSMRS